MTRLMQRRGELRASVLRQWRQPHPFDWMVGYLQARGLGAAVRRCGG
jgi:hypothetical protein